MRAIRRCPIVAAADFQIVLMYLTPQLYPVWQFLPIDLTVCERRTVMSRANVVTIAAESYK
jgi:hypothetical protein